MGIMSFFVIDAIERMQVNHFYWKKNELKYKIIVIIWSIQ